jgi:cation:H+ antiporter
MLPYLFLIIGLVLLVKGADLFVEGSSSIAKILRVPSIIIGLTIVAFGTSAPEAAVSVTASIQGQNEIAVGNVIGSNMFNLLVVVGMCAVIRRVRVKRSMIAKEFPFAILSCLILIVMALDTQLGGQSGPGVKNLLSRADGIILLIFFAMFLYSLIRFALDSRRQSAGQETEQGAMSISKSILFSLAGIAGVILGGKLTVDGASDIAASFGISQKLIGLTVVAIGTSLPELVTSIVAARKGESDLALGNAIGSNIFNAFFILGMSSAISPIPFDMTSVYDMVILGAASLLVYFFAVSKKKIYRPEGIAMIAAYAAYMVYIILR